MTTTELRSFIIAAGMHLNAAENLIVKMLTAPEIPAPEADRAHRHVSNALCQLTELCNHLHKAQPIDPHADFTRPSVD